MTYNPGEPRDDREEHRNTAPLIVVVVLLLIIVGLLGVWLYKSLSSDPAGQQVITSSKARTSHTPLSAAPSSIATTTVTPSETPKKTVTTTKSTEESPARTSSTTATTSSEKKQPVQLPQGAKFCGTGAGGVKAYSGNTVTSCEFAQAVGHQTRPTERPLQVKSPVTGQTYTVSCSGGNGTYATCTGGDNAVVYLVWDNH